MTAAEPAAVPDSTLVGRVRRRFARDGAAPTSAAVVAAVRAHPHAAALGDTGLLQLAQQVHADLVGAGPLAPLLADPDITDVLVNNDTVWVDRGRGLVRMPLRLGTAADVRRLAQRLAAAGGRRLDDSSPCADVRLPDGTRLHAVLPPVATDGPYLSLRTFRQRPFTLDDLAAGVRSTPASRSCSRRSSAHAWPTWSLVAPAPARARCWVLSSHSCQRRSGSS